MLLERSRKLLTNFYNRRWRDTSSSTKAESCRFAQASTAPAAIIVHLDFPLTPRAGL
jgi:hypothetical protein